MEALTRIAHASIRVAAEATGEAYTAAEAKANAAAQMAGLAYGLAAIGPSIGIGMIPLIAPNFKQWMPHNLHPLIESGLKSRTMGIPLSWKRGMTAATLDLGLVHQRFLTKISPLHHGFGGIRQSPIGIGVAVGVSCYETTGLTPPLSLAR